jgi:RHS repeat-associated protein
MKIGADYYFYQNDHLGTPQKMTAVNGAIVWSAKYNSFGEAQVLLSSTVINNLRFAGQYFDNETGLHYNYHRHYDPNTGRYLTPDPIGLLGGINLFSYVLNNPINLTDPWGLIWNTVDSNYKAHGIMNTLRWYLNRWTQQIGKGLDPTFPGADPEEYVGLQRGVIQEWQHDPDNPCRDKEHSMGAKRRITQKRIKVINNHPPGEALVNDINADYYYRWEPFVPNQTYKDFPESEITGDFQYWTQGR